MALVLSQNRNQPICRSESFSASWDYNYTMMEKRQLFLRSYQFCRKRSLAERIKGSLVGLKRAMWFRLRSARKLRRLVWSRLRFALYYRRRRFVRLVNSYHRHNRVSSCLCMPGLRYEKLKHDDDRKVAKPRKRGGEEIEACSAI